LAARHLEEMGLTEAQVRTTVRFLEAYANTGLRELQAVISESNRNPGHPHEALLAEPAFTIAVDTATALCDAGRWMLYLEAGAARSLLRRAGRQFLDIGQPYGAYLIETADSDDAPPYAEMLRRLTDWTVDISRWPALRHPQQQAYLMLAVAGSAQSDEFRQQAITVLEASPNANGAVPVGALGTPVRRLWDIARHLILAQPNSADVVAGHLASMARRYAETMALAQVNERLWRHGAAPVDVGDIDIAGVAALATRRFGAEAMARGTREAGLSAERDPIALAPIEAGMDLVSPDDPDASTDRRT
jgi:hypothetical protein